VAISGRNRKWWVVVAIALATILITIDFGGFMIVLPTIGRDLDTSTTGLQWSANAYLLAFAVVMVAAGRLADIVGRRRLLFIGIAIFIVASTFCGLAQADWWLDASDRVEIRGLLSGSEAAERKVAELAPAVADEVERVVREAFVYAFDGAMILCALVSVAGVVASFLVGRSAPKS
jgi:MFS family permease